MGIPGVPPPGMLHRPLPNTAVQSPSNPARFAAPPASAVAQAAASDAQFAALISFLQNTLLPPWYIPPPNFQAFDIQGVLATPAIGATGTVLQLTVPQGFNGVVRRLSINVNGPGFVQGSGSLIFGVTADGVPCKNYASILTELGSIQQPRPTDGILANSGQVYRVTVQNVSYAALGTNVVASLGGWFYPNPANVAQGS